MAAWKALWSFTCGLVLSEWLYGCVEINRPANFAIEIARERRPGDVDWNWCLAGINFKDGLLTSF